MKNWGVMGHPPFQVANLLQLQVQELFGLGGLKPSTPLGFLEASSGGFFSPIDCFQAEPRVVPKLCQGSTDSSQGQLVPRPALSRPQDPPSPSLSLRGRYHPEGGGAGVTHPGTWSLLNQNCSKMRSLIIP